MKPTHRTALSILASLAFMLVLGGCPGAEKEPQNDPQSTVYGKGQVFTMPDDDYVLDNVLFAPEYTDDTRQGYVVVFLKRVPTASVKLNSVFQDGENRLVHTSMTDFTLTEGERTVADSIKMGILENDDDTSEFKGRMLLFFQLNKGQAFPVEGRFTHIQDSNSACRIDLSGIEITDSL